MVEANQCAWILPVTDSCNVFRLWLQVILSLQVLSRSRLSMYLIFPALRCRMTDFPVLPSIELLSTHRTCAAKLASRNKQVISIFINVIKYHILILEKSIRHGFQTNTRHYCTICFLSIIIYWEIATN